MPNPENRDSVYLYRIQGYCERILQYLDLLEYEYQVFLGKQYMVDAIGMNLFQIGELAGRLSEPFRQATCDRMPWQRMKSMRNMFAHNYAHADLEHRCGKYTSSAGVLPGTAGRRSADAGDSEQLSVSGRN